MNRHQDLDRDRRRIGRAYSARFHLLDRQVIDQDEKPVCKVDDLELEQDEYGRPYVTAVLIGPAALAPRFGGLLARWLAAVQRRLSVSQGEGPARLPFEHVIAIGAVVTVRLPRDHMQLHALEDWMRDNVIGRLPGAGHAPG
ncbi:hypothetical protein AB0I94_34055 [Streptomyces sp. NPDC050147]|uniref:hypothetical protein n=1 Tax=Streptomyces sp. NPDC050147 TaxID=3155513 RepID=UPI00344AD3D7